MHIQQVSIKVLARQSELDQAPIIPIFHRWIREKRLGDDVLLIDVADYRHVPRGPGLMLIGHQGHYALDSRDGRLGLCYARKRDALGHARWRIDEALAAVFQACEALQKEPSLHGSLGFDPGQLEIHVMSRLVAPNTAETFAAIAPIAQEFLAELYGRSDIAIEHIADPRKPFGMRVHIPGDHEIAALISRF